MRRDSALIDALEELDPIKFCENVWRVVRGGRDPLQCSASGGRWDDGTFDVLYTAQEEQGAISEMKFHLLRGQPVIPTQVDYRLFELKISLERALKLLDLEALSAIGLDTSKFGRLSYQGRSEEYPRTQQIGEVAHFLDYDGLIVPSARFDGSNVVLFCDRVPPAAINIVRDHNVIDWSK